MKFHLQAPTANLVTASGPGWIRVGTTEYHDNVILLPDSIVENWTAAGFDQITVEDMTALLAHKPEIVLLGTGATQRFPHPRLLAALAGERIGVEVMDTAAACRTFNILVAENRRVVAALIVR